MCVGVLTEEVCMYAHARVHVYPHACTCTCRCTKALLLLLPYILCSLLTSFPSAFFPPSLLPGEACPVAKKPAKHVRYVNIYGMCTQ